ncbi:hypothetical protein PPACK8108_LOCUS14222 [Phakopsora pachyrhizi]|uniref:Dynein heavy chain hydrolytic ATP-binding dynein motor region domain-containing protein n=1 Tax=Phakopsora pachyrhizi TaxID=170000 RepID=A0AAV0B6R8_PHAPC|nr:hypothetical protein PPACK8108_LOCUS14222 [Phakopsora pachyrhizi]
MAWWNWKTLVDCISEACKRSPNIASGSSLEALLKIGLRTLDVLALVVLGELQPVMRRKCEYLSAELVHQRDIIRLVIKDQITKEQVYSVFRVKWIYHMRFYLDGLVADPIERLLIQMSNATFLYGFEYLGAGRLFQTPLTGRCCFALTQALHGRLGGSPFGPAGTGKTESFKALGNHLGRFVLPQLNFCCHVGAWECFDEANIL